MASSKKVLAAVAVLGSSALCSVTAQLPAPADLPAYDAFVGKEYVPVGADADIGSSDTIDAWQCGYLCLATPDCDAFTFISDKAAYGGNIPRNCWLKNLADICLVPTFEDIPSATFVKLQCADAASPAAAPLGAVPPSSDPIAPGPATVTPAVTPPAATTPAAGAPVPVSAPVEAPTPAAGAGAPVPAAAGPSGAAPGPAVAGSTPGPAEDHHDHAPGEHDDHDHEEGEHKEGETAAGPGSSLSSSDRDGVDGSADNTSEEGDDDSENWRWVLLAVAMGVVILAVCCCVAFFCNKAGSAASSAV